MYVSEHGNNTTCAIFAQPEISMLRAESAEELAYLQQLFPDGQATLYPSRYPGEDLVTFYVP